jgi:hypothetical protein
MDWLGGEVRVWGLRPPEIWFNQHVPCMTQCFLVYAAQPMQIDRCAIPWEGCPVWERVRWIGGGMGYSLLHQILILFTYLMFSMHKQVRLVY